MTFQNFLVPLINKPTRIAKANATLIGQILTNDFLDTASFTGIVKSDISDYFPIFRNGESGKGMMNRGKERGE